MKKLNYIVLLLGILLFSFSCKEPEVDDIFADMEYLPAVTFMLRTADDPDAPKLNMWGEVIKRAGLAGTLDAFYYVYTFFAPTNEAVSSYLSSKGYGSVESMSVAEAKLLVEYHTINALRTQDTFVIGTINDATASGDYLIVSFGEGGIGDGVFLNDEAKINIFDVEVTNGYIHVLDKVLTPITEKLWDRINNDSNYSIMKDAVLATGLDAFLATDSGTEIIEGFEQDVRYFYTLFAVPNSVYNDAGILDLEDLVDVLGAEVDYTSEDNKLNQYVRYHILESSKSYAELNDYGSDPKGVPLTKAVINTYYDQGLIGVTNIGEQFYLNYNTTTPDNGIIITKRNINSRNGIMHVVDDVMPVVLPERASVIFEFTQYPELGTLLGESVWRGNRTSNWTGAIPSSVSCYNWVAYPETKSNQVRYNITGRDGTTNYNAVLGQALYRDNLLINLGSFGSITMEIPTIIEGKYKVSLAHVNAGGGAGGVLTFTMDDDSIIIGTVSTRGASSSNTYRTTKIGGAEDSIEFTTTDSHTLRIVCGDNTESNLDYLLFEPI